MIDAATMIGNREMFPILDHWAFFNHAGVAPMPRIATDQIRKYANQVQMQVYLNSTWYADIEILRKLCAKLIHAHRDEIAFIKNTSEGISIVANAIDWQWGDVIVTTAIEYPANIYPWMDVARAHGAKLIMVPEERRADGAHHVPIEAILQAASDPRCRMIALSHVEYASGQQHDLVRIGEFCAQRDIYFCVDAIQSIGVVPVDVQAMKIDFLSADGHKWMLGPEGAGFFYCRRELIEHTRPLTIGWMNVINPQDYGNYDFTLKPDAGRFECGSYNVVGLLGLLGSLTLIDHIGIGIIDARVQSLIDRLDAGVRAKGYEVVSPRDPASRSGIYSFKAHGHSHELIFRKCREHKIEIAKREGRLRVAPHFYNTEQQIDHLLDVLPTH
jgi:selenocysteine lyase/cysteine desulfurase